MDTYITNLELDSRALRPRRTWMVVPVLADDGEHYQYDPVNGKGVVYISELDAQNTYTNHIFVAIVYLVDTTRVNSLTIEYSENVRRIQLDEHTVLVYGRSYDSNRAAINLDKAGSFILLGSAVFTVDDWDKLMQIVNVGLLSEPYFNGDTMPR